MSLRNRHAAYSRLGYSRELHEKVQAVELPPTIQCTRCFSDLPASAFSRRQINELKENIYMEGEEFLLGDEIKIACIPCTFNEKCESRCRNCNQIMSVEYFSRAQRNLDKPICRRCRWHMDNPEPMRPLEERSEDPKPDEPAKPKLEVTRTGWVKVRRGDDEKAAPDMVKESRVHKYAVYGPPRFIPREAFGLIPNVPPAGNTGFPADEDEYAPDFGEEKSFLSGRDSEWEGSGGEGEFVFSEGEEF